ncbi:MAG: tetratricopeptide repeat protein [Nitrospinaceae bacterium]
MDKTQLLLNDLKSSDPATRNHATQALWTLWYREAGEHAEQELQRGTSLMNQKHLKEAEQVFSGLIKKYPDFPEAHNKLATVFFLQNRYSESVAECELTLQMNPHHFGAWNGMGMGLYKLARYDQAMKSFVMACRIQPHADVNRGYIARCRAKLN